MHERTKAYPLLARKRGIEGTVYVSFRIAPDGKPEGITIRKSSGFGILDTATLDVIKKAALSLHRKPCRDSGYV